MHKKADIAVLDRFSMSGGEFKYTLLRELSSSELGSSAARVARNTSFIFYYFVYLCSHLLT